MSRNAMKAAGTFASLSSSLLARKGGARPAMRPSVSTSLEDLGWNDMGHVHEASDQGHHAGHEQETDRQQAEPEPGYPEPRKYQQAIQQEFAPAKPAAPEERPAMAVVRPIKPVSRVAAKIDPAIGKVAFTLRLDADRHLRLRLACTVSNKSAQRLVLDALDDFLKAHPEIDELAGHVPSHKAGSSK